MITVGHRTPTRSAFMLALGLLMCLGAAVQALRCDAQGDTDAPANAPF